MTDENHPKVSLTDMLQWSIAHSQPRPDGEPAFTPQMAPEEYKKWADHMFKSDADKMKGTLCRCPAF